MTRPKQNPNRISKSGSPAATTVAALLFTLALTVAATQSARSQTLHVLYNFNGGEDGQHPEARLTMDAAGNLYGTTLGYDPLRQHPCSDRQLVSQDCGTVFKLAPQGSGWAFTTLHTFRSGDDGANPAAPVTIGPDGSLYGTTQLGGLAGCGCATGTVYKLTPAGDSSWSESVIYRFNGAKGDGQQPGGGAVAFDQQGNLYGTTFFGGPAAGILYELTPANGYWRETVVHGFSGHEGDGSNPWSGVSIDSAGNLYGTTYYGPQNNGTVYEVSPVNGGWKETVLHNFAYLDGYRPQAGVILDGAGKLYGATATGGLWGDGTMFTLTSNDGDWTFAQLYNWGFVYGAMGPTDNLTLDSSGNLYGTTLSDGRNGYGSVFKLTINADGTRSYSDLYDFGCGSYLSGVIADRAGNVYGTAQTCGEHGYGFVYEITP